MKLDSELFDKIRIKPATERKLPKQAPACAWPGCKGSGQHPAPMGRGREGEYFLFCIEHVREYNRGYNYFTGMSDDAVALYQQQNVTGHRPTWPMGANTAKPGFSQDAPDGTARASWSPGPMHDPFSFLGRRQGSTYYGAKPERPMHNAERKARETLNLEADAEAAQIKLRYKQLVKRHHPDANGGDRSSEEKLREIIQAYTYLKSAGFC